MTDALEYSIVPVLRHSPTFGSDHSFDLNRDHNPMGVEVDSAGSKVDAKKKTEVLAGPDLLWRSVFRWKGPTPPAHRRLGLRDRREHSGCGERWYPSVYAPERRREGPSLLQQGRVRLRCRARPLPLPRGSVPPPRRGRHAARRSRAHSKNSVRKSRRAPRSLTSLSRGVACPSRLVVCDHVTPTVRAIANSWVEIRIENEVMVVNGSSGAWPQIGESSSKTCFRSSIKSRPQSSVIMIRQTTRRRSDRQSRSFRAWKCHLRGAAGLRIGQGCSDCWGGQAPVLYEAVFCPGNHHSPATSKWQAWEHSFTGRIWPSCVAIRSWQ